MSVEGTPRALEPIPPMLMAQAGDECAGATAKLQTLANAQIMEKVPIRATEVPTTCPLPRTPQTPRGQQPITFSWTASALCHKPPYFEDIQLERYGHSWGPFLQPVLSAAHFVVTVPALPYLMGLNPPNECVYTLGYYRPGSCAPYMLDPLPLSVRAAMFEGVTVAGGILLIP